MPLQSWLTALWLILQSDKGISSVRLAEAVGVSQPTAWRMEHVLRLLVTQEQLLTGMVELDELFVGGAPRRDADRPRLGRGRKGQPRTTKTPVLAIVQRPANHEEGTQAGAAKGRVVKDLSELEADRVLSEHVDPSAHLMSDEWKSFMSVGDAFAAHDTVRHCDREYARGAVRANAVEGFNDRIHRTVAGVFHHISLSRVTPWLAAAMRPRPRLVASARMAASRAFSSSQRSPVRRLVKADAKPVMRFTS